MGLRRNMTSIFTAFQIAKSLTFYRNIHDQFAGKRFHGRNPMRWSDQIRTTLDTTIYDAIHTAENRRWRNIIQRRIMGEDGHNPHTGK